MLNFFDLHCDTAYECYKTGQSIAGNSLAVDFDYVTLFELYKAVFAVWLPENAPEPFQLYQNILAAFTKQLKQYHFYGNALFSVENAAFLAENLTRLQQLYQDGIRSLTLTWNNTNALAGGAYDEGGITATGKQVIAGMNRLGMALDASHLNDQSVFEALDLADIIFASHTACRSVVDDKRNLTDNAILQIAKKGGIIGICFYPKFVGDGDVFEAIEQNIKHLLLLGLDDYIAIGSDFDGAAMNEQLSHILHIPALQRFLEQRGMKNELLDKIFYKNAERFYKLFLTNRSL